MGPNVKTMVAKLEKIVVNTPKHGDYQVTVSQSSELTNYEKSKKYERQESSVTTVFDEKFDSAGEHDSRIFIRFPSSSNSYETTIEDAITVSTLSSVNTDSITDLNPRFDLKSKPIFFINM